MAEPESTPEQRARECLDRIASDGRPTRRRRTEQIIAEALRAAEAAATADLRQAILDYANHQPLDLKRPHEIQRDLWALAGVKR